MRVVQEQMGAARGGGVCDFSRGYIQSSHCLSRHKDELAWPVVVCECVVAMGRWGNASGGSWVSVREREEMYIPCPNKFPNAWIRPAGCQTGGCLCLPRPPSDSNVSWLAPEKQGTSKCMMTAALKIMTGKRSNRYQKAYVLVCAAWQTVSGITRSCISV